MTVGIDINIHQVYPHLSELMLGKLCPSPPPPPHHTHTQTGSVPLIENDHLCAHYIELPPLNGPKFLCTKSRFH